MPFCHCKVLSGCGCVLLFGSAEGCLCLYMNSLSWSGASVLSWWPQQLFLCPSQGGEDEGMLDVILFLLLLLPLLLLVATVYQVASLGQVHSVRGLVEQHSSPLDRLRDMKSEKTVTLPKVT